MFKDPTKFHHDVISFSDKHYERFFHERRSNFGIKGKYMFTSLDRELLRWIAVSELETGLFAQSKVSRSLSVKHGLEYVLCIYHTNDSKAKQMGEKYMHNQLLHYLGWKQNDAYEKV